MRIRNTVPFVVSLVLAACLANSSNASIITALVYNPPSTAGPGSTSTRSGPATWHLYAIDDSDADFGISSYSVALPGATAINHRSPATTIIDENGDPQTAGFTLLRSGTNVTPIVASQGLPGSTPYLVTGFGQTAGNFCALTGGICTPVVGPTTSQSWGNYTHPVLNDPAMLSVFHPAAGTAVASGKKWVFLAEGLGFPLTATTSFTVFSNTSGASVATPSSSLIIYDIPEPASAMLLIAGLLFANCSRRQRGRRNG